jgi:hypothetical protein
MDKLACYEYMTKMNINHMGLRCQAISGLAAAMVPENWKFAKNRWMKIVGD